MPWLTASRFNTTSITLAGDEGSTGRVLEFDDERRPSVTRGPCAPRGRLASTGTTTS
jgi:hypothetical protein